jgi:hypothetical protein
MQLDLEATVEWYKVIRLPEPWWATIGWKEKYWLEGTLVVDRRLNCYFQSYIMDSKWKTFLLKEQKIICDGRHNEPLPRIGI